MERRPVELTAADFASFDRTMEQSFSDATQEMSDVTEHTQPSLLDSVAIRQSMVQHFDSFLANYRNPDGTIDRLTERQSKSLTKVRQFIAEDNTTGYLKLPCGYGKSALAIYIAAAAGAGTVERNGRRTQVLLNTSRNTIIRQLVRKNFHYDTGETSSDFEYFAPYLRPSIYNQHSKDLTGDVVLMPYQSLRYLSEQSRAPYFPLLLLDESQNVGQKRKQIIETADAVVKIGLSATPGRSARYLQKSIDEVSLLEGIVTYSFLCDMEMSGIATGYDFVAPKAHSREYTVAGTEPLSYSKERNKLIVDTIYSNVLHFGKGIVKCHRRLRNRSHANDIAALASLSPPLVTRNGKTRPLRVESLSYENPKCERLIDEFTYDDTIDALTYVDLLGQGINFQMNWGLWTPPTRSLDALEQFAGRGLRKNDAQPQKVFRFFQLVDFETDAANNAAFGWEVVGAPRSSRKVRVSGGNTGPAGISYDGAETQPYTIQELAKHMNTVTLAFKSEAADPAIPLVDLDSLERFAEIDRSWLRRILYHGGFVARATITDNEPTIAYQADAIGFIADSVATTVDKTFPEVMALLKVAENHLVQLMAKRGVSAPLLYRRNAGADRLALTRHLRPADVAKLLSGSAEYDVIVPGEIPLQSVMRDLGIRKNIVAFVDYLQVRGYTLTKRKLASKDSEAQHVGLRAELLPWMTAYQEAKPLPRKGYIAIRSYAWKQFPQGKPKQQEVFTALRMMGIVPHIFSSESGSRNDYVAEKYDATIIEKLAVLVANRQHIDTNSIRKPEVATKIATQLGIATHTVEYHAEQMGVDLTHVKTLGQVGGFIEKLTVTVRDISVVMQEPDLLAAVTGTTRQIPDIAPKTSVVSARPPVHSNIESYENRGSRENLETSTIIQQHFKENRWPPAICRQIMALHATASKMPIDDSAQRAVLFDTIHNILTHTAGWQSIGTDWVSSRDLAAELGVADKQLVQLWIHQRISAQHVQFVEISGIPGIQVFCSAAFALFMKAGANRSSNL